MAAAGFGWPALGVLIYVAFRRHHGLDLRSTHKVAIAQPVVDQEAEYDSVLVPLIDGAYDVMCWPPRRSSPHAGDEESTSWRW